MMIGLGIGIGMDLGRAFVDYPATSGVADSDSSTLTAGLVTDYANTTGTADSDSSTLTANLTFLPSNLSAWNGVGLGLASFTGGFADPMGGTGAFKAVENTAASTTHEAQFAGSNPGSSCTLEIWVAPGASNNRHFLEPGTATDFKFLDVAAGTSQGGTGTATLMNTVTAGGVIFQLWRYVLSNWNAGTTMHLYLANNTPTNVYTGDGASHLYMFQPAVYV